MESPFVELDIEIKALRKRMSDLQAVITQIDHANRGQYGEVSDSGIDDIIDRARTGGLMGGINL